MRIHPGIIAGASAPVVGGPGALTDFTFNTARVMGGVKTITIPVGTPANTLLGTVSGVVGTLNSLSFVAGGDDSGRLKLVGNALYSNDLMDFETPGRPVTTYGIAQYVVKLHGVGPNSSFVDVQIRIAPHFAKIEATGGTAAAWNGITPNIFVYPNYKNFCDSGSAGDAGKVMRISPLVIGVQVGEGTNTNRVASGNRTFWGHKRIIFHKNYGIETNTPTWGPFAGIRPKNLLFKHMAMRVGGDPGGADLSNRDNMQITSGDTILFENCSFSWSTDELVQIFRDSSPKPRRIRFHRCFFAQPLAEAGHEKGNHPFGPLNGAQVMDLVYDKCVFLGLNQRSPAGHSMRGWVIQNSIIARFGANNQNGGSFIINDWDSSHNILRTGDDEATTIIRGNLYQDFSPASRLYPILMMNVGVPSKVYVSEGAKNDANHFFKLDGTMGGTPVLSNDPLTRAANIGSAPSNISKVEPAAFVDYEPFGTDMDSELMPTATDAQRRALWNDVINNVGCRDDGTGATTPGLTGMTQIDYELMNHFLSTGTALAGKGQYPPILDSLGRPVRVTSPGRGDQPVPSNATYDFTKLGLPPGAPPWPVDTSS